jgi:hypothetical protein
MQWRSPPNFCGIILKMRGSKVILGIRRWVGSCGRKVGMCHMWRCAAIIEAGPIRRWGICVSSHVGIRSAMRASMLASMRSIMRSTVWALWALWDMRALLAVRSRRGMRRDQTRQHHGGAKVGRCVIRTGGNQGRRWISRKQFDRRTDRRSRLMGVMLHGRNLRTGFPRWWVAWGTGKIWSEGDVVGGG